MTSVIIKQANVLGDVTITGQGKGVTYAAITITAVTVTQHVATVTMMTYVTT